ncbi:MAG: recombinase family protein [Bryobacter sp.]|nr:recombinase family protein [Bryobacter sp.]
MKNPPKTRPEDFREAVLYMRVSSKEQEEEGFSISAQRRLLLEFAGRHELGVVREFEEVESAKQAGRPQFEAMLQFLKPRAADTIVLVEKTDRLTRNHYDAGSLERLGIAFLCVKECRFIGPYSRSSDKLIHSVQLAMAKHQTDNLSEETSKGMLEKAKQGYYPSCAPVGYRNVEGANGKRTIAPSEPEASLVRWLFEQFGQGLLSVKALTAQAKAQGLRLRGKNLSSSVAHQILRRRMYSGSFDWNGEVYAGNYEPIVSADLWNRVQDVLNGRRISKSRKVKRDFLFRGFLRCGRCGCLFTGELKKGRYVYYHCTGNRGKCGNTYTREEALEAALISTLGDLVVPAPVLAWLDAEIASREEMAASATKARAVQLRRELGRAESRWKTLYEDRLEGRITPEDFDAYASDARERCSRLKADLEMLESTRPNLMEGLKAVEIISEACRLFPKQGIAEQRKLLTLLLDNASFNQGEFECWLKTPFQELRRSNSATQRNFNDLVGKEGLVENWLPG